MITMASLAVHQIPASLVEDARHYLATGHWTPRHDDSARAVEVLDALPVGHADAPVLARLLANRMIDDLGADAGAALAWTLTDPTDPSGDIPAIVARNS